MPQTTLNGLYTIELNVNRDNGGGLFGASLTLNFHSGQPFDIKEIGLKRSAYAEVFFLE